MYVYIHIPCICSFLFKLSTYVLVLQGYSLSAISLFYTKQYFLSFHFTRITNYYSNYTNLHSYIRIYLHLLQSHKILISELYFFWFLCNLRDFFSFTQKNREKGTSQNFWCFRKFFLLIN